MTKTILVADDSVTIRKVVELAFHDTEFRVEAAGSGEAALERFGAVRFDLVLADVVMPAPDGYAICEQVKRSGRPVPVLLLAGAFEPFDAQRANACGADGHVRKPFDSRALLARVRELIASAATRSGAAPAAHPADEAPQPPAAPLARVSIDEVLSDLAAAAQPDAPAVLPPRAAAGTDAMDLLLGDLEPPPRAEVPAHAPQRTMDASPEPDPAPAAPPTTRLSPEELDAVARAVVAKLSDQVLREIAWEIVPELAETLVRERIQQLERADSERTS